MKKLVIIVEGDSAESAYVAGLEDMVHTFLPLAGLKSGDITCAFVDEDGMAELVREVNG
ncbi:hypothetical protein vBLivaVAfA18_023 [Listeria phage vB_Liva_VAfA18]|uniref:Uncharacterized protein n=1 Tax=Listeria phage vB_Liva_VAfA18 TaxID=2712945 RepID=A0A858ECL5_9CAUD|nr:hypothetical protein vBLivaVAfA18_023 [Listeria phage vB_Liva_VAfA18]